MSTQLAKTQKEKPMGLKALINQDVIRDQIRLALPTHLKPERFIRIATTALSRVPKLKDCTPESFMRCLLDLSAMGLEPDGRRAHLIPYRDNKRDVTECQLLIDYKGLVELVRRSGDVSDIHCDVVCTNDVFRENLGQIEAHVIDRKRPRGEVFAAYSRVTLKDGTVSCEVMSRDEIEGIRKRSRAANAGPWVTDWNEMAKKTVFRRHSKWLPISSDVRELVEKDDEYQLPERNVTPAPNPFAHAAPAIEQREEEPEEQEQEPPKRAKKTTKKKSREAQEPPAERQSTASPSDVGGGAPDPEIEVETPEDPPAAEEEEDEIPGNEPVPYEVEGKVLSLSHNSGTDEKGRTWHLHTATLEVDPETTIAVSTFSATTAAKLVKGTRVLVAYQRTDKGNHILSVTKA